MLLLNVPQSKEAMYSKQKDFFLNAWLCEGFFPCSGLLQFAGKSHSCIWKFCRYLEILQNSWIILIRRLFYSIWSQSMAVKESREFLLGFWIPCKMWAKCENSLRVKCPWDVWCLFHCSGFLRLEICMIEIETLFQSVFITRKYCQVFQNHEPKLAVAHEIPRQCPHWNSDRWDPNYFESLISNWYI